MNPTLLVLAILFFSTLVRATFGFGDALVAMPLLALVVGVQTATPLVQLVAITIGLAIAGQTWRSIDLRITWRLILASILGIPVGLILLKTAPEALVIKGLGILLMAYGLYHLFRPQMPFLAGRWWAFGFGFLAGVLGGAYNTNGPPVIIYGTLRRWSPERFRATLQGYFVPTGLFILAGHGLGGLWTGRVLALYGLALPVVGLAVFTGNMLARRISAQRFARLIYIVLVGMGALLLVR